MSLWLLFVMIIIITIRIPICFSKDYLFVGISYLLLTNIIPLCSGLALLIGGCSYFNFEHQLKGTKELTFKITGIENIDYEHLSFLTTYIIPLVCFLFENLWYVIVFVILLIIIGFIYIRTDIFYTNISRTPLFWRSLRTSNQKFAPSLLETYIPRSSLWPSLLIPKTL